MTRREVFRSLALVEPTSRTIRHGKALHCVEASIVDQLLEIRQKVRETTVKRMIEPCIWWGRNEPHTRTHDQPELAQAGARSIEQFDIVSRGARHEFALARDH